MNQLVYVAIVNDKDYFPSCNDVIAVNTDRKKLEEFIMDYHGISETKKYTYPDKYLGFTKIEYSEYEDPLLGYYTFESTHPSDMGETDKIYLFYVELNEKPLK